MRVTATVLNGGELDPESVVKLMKYLSKIPEGTVVELEISKPVSARSPAQNRYYHGVIVEPMRQYLGIQNRETMHDVLKTLHLSEKIRLPHDRRRKMEITKSTTDLTTMEFEDYLERIRTWARKELRYRIPLPNEVPLYAYCADQC